MATRRFRQSPRFSDLAALLALCLALAGCSALTPQSPRDGRIHHVVLLWLKTPGDERARREILAASEQLRRIPGVMTMTSGVVVASDRPIVDDSFDVGLTLTFRDQQALERYLEHPLHRQLVREVIRPRVARIRVHDYREIPR
ncbi:Dabb family protein [Thiohalobacter sp.]|uniref:Dabb family protein n=1 Tax=Thiohalobacter sp. TaxID=2025948 RepID=UPI002636504C|nr:Dabb family protein [Thiohalobacter sp.]